MALRYGYRLLSSALRSSPCRHTSTAATFHGISSPAPPAATAGLPCAASGLLETIKTSFDGLQSAARLANVSPAVAGEAASSAASAAAAVNGSVGRSELGVSLTDMGRDVVERWVARDGLLWWVGRLMRRTWQPSKWRWYHRHGYWATRKKKLKFDKYCRYRYHEVKGYGRMQAKWWEDKSYYRPLDKHKYTRFW